LEVELETITGRGAGIGSGPDARGRDRLRLEVRIVVVESGYTVRAVDPRQLPLEAGLVVPDDFLVEFHGRERRLIEAQAVWPTSAGDAGEDVCLGRKFVPRRQPGDPGRGVGAVDQPAGCRTEGIVAAAASQDETQPPRCRTV